METETTLDEIKQEIKSILLSASDNLMKHYGEIRKCYLESYHLSEIDPVREEICKCIAFGFNQAAVTLTNNLLEKSLKALLINHEFKKSSPDGFNSENIKEVFRAPVEKFSSKSMEQTINACATRNIITKVQKKQLIEFKNKIRDSFSHGEINKIVGNKTVPFAIGNLKDPTDIKHFEMEISSLPFIGGMVQVEIAKQLALNYFLIVHGIIRYGIFKIYGDLFEYK